MIKILIVDDEPNVVDFLARYFNDRSDKYQTFTAVNGNDAWDLIVRERPNIVLLDLKMPRFNGSYVLKKMRNEGIKNVSVLVITAFDEKDRINEALALGAVGYIRKPFSLLTLEDTVRSYLPKL